MNINILGSINKEKIKDEIVKSMSIINIEYKYDTDNYEKYKTIYSFKTDKKDIMKDIIFYDINIFSNFCYRYLNFKYNVHFNGIAYTWSNEICNFLNIDSKSELSNSTIIDMIKKHTIVYTTVNNIEIKSYKLNKNLQEFFGIPIDIIYQSELHKKVIYHKKKQAISKILIEEKFEEILKSINFNNYDIRNKNIIDFIKNILYIEHQDIFKEFVKKIDYFIDELSYDNFVNIFNRLDYIIDIINIKDNSIYLTPVLKLI